MLMGIIADIHGNYPALQAVIEDLDMLGCKKIISLGDVCGYYPFINECIELLRERKVTHLLGNHDYYMITGTDCPRSVTANKCLAYQRTVIKTENLEWLKKSKKTFENKDMSMVHGNWEDPIDGYLYNVNEDLFKGKKQKLLFAAHTHVQNLFVFKSGIFCNPGSVGQPRDGEAWAAFATYEDEVGLQRASYNIDATAKKMKDLGFEDKTFMNLYTGSRIGGYIDSITNRESE